MGNLSTQIRRASLLAASMFVLSTGTLSAEPVTEQQAHAIGVNAYLYFYSPVTMDVTRKQLSNVEPGKVSARPRSDKANDRNKARDQCCNDNVG